MQEKLESYSQKPGNKMLKWTLLLSRQSEGQFTSSQPMIERKTGFYGDKFLSAASMYSFATFPKRLRLLIKTVTYRE